MRDLKMASALVIAALMIGCNKDESTTTPPAPSSPSAPARPGADATSGAPAVPSAGTTDTMAATQTKASELLQQGMNYVKENKLDLAEKTLTQLEGMKGQLPADWAPRIEQLRSAIQAAKLAGGKAPGGIGIPK